MSIQHIWNLSRLLGLLIAVNFIPTTSEQHSKTTRHKLCWGQLGTSHDVLKSFAIGSFLERFVVKIASDYVCWKTLNMLVKSAQNQLISSEICPENSHETGRFYLLFFGEVSPENFCEIPATSADFSANLSKNPAKLDFFLRDQSDALKLLLNS